jgi:hypothetical protein
VHPTIKTALSLRLVKGLKSAGGPIPPHPQACRSQQPLSAAHRITPEDNSWG